MNIPNDISEDRRKFRTFVSFFLIFLLGLDIAIASAFAAPREKIKLNKKNTKTRTRTPYSLYSHLLVNY